MMSALQQQKLVVEQLRKEASIKRVMISQAVQDIIKYIRERESEDYLLKGFSSQKANPFREKSICSITWVRSALVCILLCVDNEFTILYDSTRQAFLYYIFINQIH